MSQVRQMRKLASETVLAGQSSWMILPGKAVFIPAQRLHCIRMWGTVAMRSLYFPPTLEAPALRSDECRVISVTPLLRELILRVVELSALDSGYTSVSAFIAAFKRTFGFTPRTLLQQENLIAGRLLQKRSLLQLVERLA
jgi:hypothetical protein